MKLESAFYFITLVLPNTNSCILIQIFSSVKYVPVSVNQPTTLAPRNVVFGSSFWQTWSGTRKATNGEWTLMLLLRTSTPTYLPFQLSRGTAISKERLLLWPVLSQIMLGKGDRFSAYLYVWCVFLIWSFCDCWCFHASFICVR